jgi:hypothetical protein
MTEECLADIEAADEHSADVRWRLNGEGLRMTANVLLAGARPIRVLGTGQRK